MRKIIIVVIILVVIHLGVGLFISPLLKPYLVNKINQYSKARVSIGSFSFWPFTLSVTLKDLKVSDPDDATKSILRASGVSAYVSPLGLLKKQFILSRVFLSDASISLKKAWISKGSRFLRKGFSGEVSAENSAGMNSKEGNTIVIDNARIEMWDVRIVSAGLPRLGRFNISGDIKSSGIEAGNLRLDLRNIYSKDNPSIAFDLMLKDVDLNALRFIYQDSLPVQVIRGTLDLESKTVLTGEAIDSKNSLALRNHELVAKDTQEESKGFMPTSMICGTLNQINPVKLDFDIGGTLEKPEFKNFQKSLMNLVMSNTKAIQFQLQDKAFEAIGDYFKKRKKKKEEETANAPATAPAPEVAPQSQPSAVPEVAAVPVQDTLPSSAPAPASPSSEDFK
jgi:hypothetical protein